MGVKLNRSDLAAHLGKSLPTIDRWIKDGMPVVRRGGRGVEWEFDLADVISWQIDVARAAAGGDATDLAEIEKRTAAAKMLKAELELAKARGEVAPLAQIERNLAKVFAEVRANMRNIPSAVVSDIIGETDERRLKSVLLEEIDKALEALATADLTAEDDDDDSGEEEA